MNNNDTQNTSNILVSSSKKGLSFDTTPQDFELKAQNTLQRYKWHFLGIILFLLVATTTGFLIVQKMEKAKQEIAEKILLFEKKYLPEEKKTDNPFAPKKEEDKLPPLPEDIAQIALSFFKEINYSEQALKISLMLFDRLFAENRTQEGVTILKEIFAKQKSSSDYSYFFLGTRLAAGHEDLGNIDDSLAIYDKLTKLKSKILEDFIYFSLGRLYEKKGNKEFAKKSLQYVVEKHPKSPYLALAKAYLNRYSLEEHTK